jgi:hypothetical protein
LARALRCRLCITLQLSGRELSCEVHREHIVKWRARGVAAMAYHRPRQLLVMRLLYHQ